MKRIILSAAVVVVGIAATSCKKSYTCECYTPTTTGNPEITYTTVKEKDQATADNTCYAMGSASTGKQCALLNLH